MNALAAALAYAERGWPVFPVGTHKRPLTAHGMKDATCEPEQIRGWWSRFPEALAAIATGERSGVVAIDIDVRESVNGFDALEELGVSCHPKTPTSHTPSGGVHMLFEHPGHHVKTIAGRLGRGIDVRGDGGSITLPPGPSRRWDPLLGLDTALAQFPTWANISEPTPEVQQGPRPTVRVQLSRYGEAALDNAVKRIVSAPAGAQETTLNKETYAIGQLAGGSVIPPGLALEGLLWAARNMPSFDRNRPWRVVDVERKVQASFAAGLRKPREPDHGRR